MTAFKVESGSLKAIVSYQKMLAPPPPCFSSTDPGPFQLFTFMDEWVLGNPHTFASPEEMQKIHKSNGAWSHIAPVYCYNKQGPVVSMRPLPHYSGLPYKGFVVAVESRLRDFYHWQQITTTRRQMITDRIEELIHYYQVFLDGDVYFGYMTNLQGKGRISLGLAYDDNPEAWYAELARSYLENGTDVLIKERIKPENMPWSSAFRPWAQQGDKP